MVLFIAIYFLIYGAIHFYFYQKLRASFSPEWKLNLLIILLLLLMFLAPLLIHGLEKAGLAFFGRLLAYIGYTWLGIIFLFLSVSLLLDLYYLVLQLTNHIAKADLSNLFLSPLNRFCIPFGLALLISVYGFFEARNLRIERIAIESPKIPPEVGEIKIAQISDVHLGLIVGERRLKQIINILKSEAPDMIVSTGDLLDASICDLEGIAERLNQVDPKYGKFAVTGNHEFYAGLRQALKCTEEAGFTILRGEGMEIDGFINVVGVDDPEAIRFGLGERVDEKKLLESLPRDQFVLFLKHRPNVSENTLGMFDLMLSGHTHKGQIFPFNLITGPFFTANAGLKKLSADSYLYVSRGTGTWGPPIRFLAPPEVTVIRIVASQK